MLKIVLEIEEKEEKDLDTIKARCVDVNIVETRTKKTTKGEVKSRDLLMERLGLNEKIQVMNDCRNERNKEIVDLISSLLK